MGSAGRAGGGGKPSAPPKIARTCRSPPCPRAVKMAAAHAPGATAKKEQYVYRDEKLEKLKSEVSFPL